MIVLELIFAGFCSAIGWWGANHYVVEKYLEPPKVEKKVEEKE